MARPTTKKRAVKQTKKRKRRFFLPYPLFLFLFLCAGTFLVAATLNVGADDILVRAKVSAPFVTSPATITSPINGAHFSFIPITISGTCPTNAGYVEIFRNSLMSGSAICSGGGTFELQTDLFSGQNELIAHVFNITDDEGPVANAITVYYDVPKPPVITTSQPTSPSLPTAASPLVLKTAFVYKGYYVGQEVEWPIEISGGTRPYALDVDWGDGTNDVISRGSEGEFKLNHTYSKPGGYQENYLVKVKASDAAGQTAYIQFFVIVNTQQTAATSGNIFTKPPPSLGSKNWLWYAWPAYGLVFILGLSFWLGEHEELLILKKHGQLKH